MISSTVLKHFPSPPTKRIILSIPSIDTNDVSSSEKNERRYTFEHQWCNHHRFFPLSLLHRLSSPPSSLLATPPPLHHQFRRGIARAVNKPGLPRNHPHKVRFIYRKSMARRISPRERLLYNAAQLMPNRWPDLFLNSGRRRRRPHRDNRRSVYGYTTSGSRTRALCVVFTDWTGLLAY